MTDTERIATLRISLAEITPEIWRRVEVPVEMSLKGLHDVIQAVFGWEDYHLFEFRVRERACGVPDPDGFGDGVRQARLAKLGALVDRGVEQFEYMYDFGDGWLHLIEVEAVADGDPGFKYPRFVDGARRGPPEDVGGMPGYENFLEAVGNPRHPEHRQMVEWYGGSYEPGDIGLSELRSRLGQIAKRRHAGRLAEAKRRGRRAP